MKHSFFLGFTFLLLLLRPTPPVVAGSFQIAGNTFLLDGKPFLVHSGEIHYARIPREYWRERLHTVHAMGLNTICTYIFWDIHEPEQGKWDFTGGNDVAAFIRLAQKEGLHVLIRPGPYVCSEWDFGGLPPWLLKEPDIKVRCMDPRYLHAVREYINRLAKELVPLQIDHGGPILMVQVENEYGSFGNDTNYTRTIATYLRKAGFTVPFYTSDGPSRALLEAGTVGGIIPVVNFGGDAKEAFRELEAFRPGVPEMSGEYWCGWFTHWRDSLWGTADTKRQLEDLRWMIATGKSFNLYMAHGGTNFGWMAGANDQQVFEPDVTSYDYDAPVDETGRPRAKYFAMRAAITPDTAGMSPAPPRPLIAVASFPLGESAALLENLPRPIHAVQPASMEHYGQSFGYILYRTNLIGPHAGRLTVTEPHDIALVMLDGKILGTLDRTKGQSSIDVPRTEPPSHRLDILVCAFGRVNFGARLLDRKGITERVTLDGVTLMNWDVYLLPFEPSYLSSLQFHAADTLAGPKVYRGSFSIDKPGDTFLDMSSWNQGAVWVNGKNIGRFWNVGPQHRLYVPGVWLRSGRNDVVVFDMTGGSHLTLQGLAAPEYP